MRVSANEKVGASELAVRDDEGVALGRHNRRLVKADVLYPAAVLAGFDESPFWMLPSSSRVMPPTKLLSMSWRARPMTAAATAEVAKRPLTLTPRDKRSWTRMAM